VVAIHEGANAHDNPRFTCSRRRSLQAANEMNSAKRLYAAKRYIKRSRAEHLFADRFCDRAFMAIVRALARCEGLPTLYIKAT
jgi:hypothetical protein